ncbi:ABC transporter permease [Enterococcus hulanensis]|uniref:ABC transporter permease n=1 Tax=Enterococcus hulanensis TaxID=2559929 RepID=A0ABU3EZD6_9ENTE|nr:ABC transporter permease [Enterococcus hulanensis]MDT2600021.1 ABC transporter permease [Enterococcus hulanensis]MDT2610095.1 ABC transporter permease [Enterococcus hulanensis]MDT2617903.1 ABC transporter permease [Enterococcus hulanensis]MDT2629873.1 ABC transporter permease [Enterococcus hulanensis]MDT2656468.1 ABC transporter permease [Enterococcus hulanensis]
MNALVYRGLSLFFKNRQAVIGSFIGAAIMIILYVFLLGESLVGSLSVLTHPKLVVDAWMLAGVIGIASASSTLGSVSLMIRDKESNVYTDFMISPISKSKIMLGYFFSTFLISLLITLVVIVIAEIYLVVLSKGEFLTLPQFGLLFVVSILTVFCSSAFMFFVASFFRRIDTFSTVTAVIGPLIGFLTGCYVPIGSLPEGVQKVVEYFPLTSGIVLIRRILTENVFSSADKSAATMVKEELGIVMSGQTGIALPIAILVISSCLFLGVALWNVKRVEVKR